MTAPTLAEIDRDAGARELVARLLDAAQIADLMHVTKRSVYRMVEEGKFPPPALMIGRYARWLASDYNAWVEAQTQRQRRA